MNGLRITGQDVRAVMVIDGQPQGGTFLKVNNLTFTPDIEQTKTAFLGEDSLEPDMIYKGVDFSMTIHESDNSAVDRFLSPLVSKLRAGQPLPNINLVVSKHYADNSVKTITLQNVVAKVDSQSYSGTDYATTSISGACRYYQVS